MPRTVYHEPSGISGTICDPHFYFEISKQRDVACVAIGTCHHGVKTKDNQMCSYAEKFGLFCADGPRQDILDFENQRPTNSQL